MRTESEIEKEVKKLERRLKKAKGFPEKLYIQTRLITLLWVSVPSEDDIIGKWSKKLTK